MLLALALLAARQAEAPRFDASGHFETTETVVAAQAQGQLLPLEQQTAAGAPAMVQRVLDGMP